MTPDTVGWGFGGDGSHACLVHDSPQERLRILESHVVNAFARGRRVIVVAESTNDQLLSDLFARTGHGARPGQLDVRTAAESYASVRPFDAASMLARLEDDKRRALADGFTGVHFVADNGY